MKFPYLDNAPAPATMPLSFSVAVGETEPPTASDLPREKPGSNYLPSPGLIDAINASILLGRPLLLTGEPGTGKTTFAEWVNHKVNGCAAECLAFHTKSTSEASDLFYSFDTMARFHAANIGTGSQENEDYLHLNALGRAIMLAQLKAIQMKDGELSEEEHRTRDELVGLLGIEADTSIPHHHVVLIDEIDKAPRDFPNDLLHEFDRLSFRVAELDRTFAAPREFRPILILTSNSEKSLPDPFLRRCCFCNIDFPDKEVLARILTTRIKGLRVASTEPALENAEASPPLTSSPTVNDEPANLLDDALVFLEKLRGSGLGKPPATAEMIDWLECLIALGADANRPLKDQWKVVEPSLAALGKSISDQELTLREARNYFKTS